MNPTFETADPIAEMGKKHDVASDQNGAGAEAVKTVLDQPELPGA